MSDAHANYPALNAVIEDTKESVDGYIYLGDIVGLMGFPSETVDTLQKYGTYVLRGNHDIKVIDDNEGWVNDPELSTFERDLTHTELSSTQKKWISELNSLEYIDQEKFVLSHGEPCAGKSHGIGVGGLNKRNFVTYASKYSDMDFVLVGHTHNQEALDCSSFGHSVIVLNPGTVGQTDTNMADYAVINTETHSYSLHSTSYDYDAVKDRLDSFDIPRGWY